MLSTKGGKSMFMELDNNEMMQIDGGIAITTLIVGGLVVCGVSFVAGVAVSAYNSYKDCERKYGK